MNLDEIYNAVRRVMQDLRLPGENAYVNLYVDTSYPMASVVYPCKAEALAHIDFVENEDGIPIFNTREGMLRVTVQASPEREVAA